MSNSNGIPAAQIAGIDLDAIVDRDVAAEIGRLGELMHGGKETDEEFCQLCQLLVDAGERDKAEELLRCNIDEGDPAHELYIKLFGNKKQQELETAIGSFKSQFNVSLKLTQKVRYLSWRFLSESRTRRCDDYRLLNSPCTILFGYCEQNTIESDVVLLDHSDDILKPDESLLMFYLGGVWKIVDPMTRQLDRNP